MNLKLNGVDFISQHKDISNCEWRRKSCGIVCLTVVLNFLSKSKKYTADYLNSLKTKDIERYFFKRQKLGNLD